MYLYPSRRDLLLFAWLAAAHMLLGGSQDQKSSPKPDASQPHETEAKPEEQVYEPGGDVKAPKLVHHVEPSFSTSSKEAFVEGAVKISTVIKTDGKPGSMKVVHGLNTEEDRTAMEALKQWTFQPGTKGGRVVPVRVTVEIDFHLL